jgi:hypothetical protein
MGILHITGGSDTSGCDRADDEIPGVVYILCLYLLFSLYLKSLPAHGSLLHICNRILTK